MNPSSPSLLSFLETPVLVGDPEGQTVFVNPSFENRFRTTRERVLGKPLAMLFEGQGREKMLEAVAQVCQSGESVRFRVREQGVTFTALASAITAEGGSVGVVLLLLQDVLEEERLLAFCREIRKPIDELCECLEELFDQTGGRRAERFRDRLEEGVRTLNRLRKWTDELRAAAMDPLACAGADGTFDPVRVVRDAVTSLERDASRARRELELLLPARLPEVKGDGTRFGAGLTSLLRHRLQNSPSRCFTVAAKAVGQGSRAAVLISLIEAPQEKGSPPFDEAEVPALVLEMVKSLGGSVSTTDDEVFGRTTSIRLPVVS